MVAAILDFKEGAGMFGEGAGHVRRCVADGHDVGDPDFLCCLQHIRHPRGGWGLGRQGTVLGLRSRLPLG